tara:strand:- start:420 stop:2645 length:2226 start_codon:yes stop_codon:yes gene_type:complete
MANDDGVHNDEKVNILFKNYMNFISTSDDKPFYEESLLKNNNNIFSDNILTDNPPADPSWATVPDATTLQNYLVNSGLTNISIDNTWFIDKTQGTRVDLDQGSFKYDELVDSSVVLRLSRIKLDYLGNNAFVCNASSTVVGDASINILQNLIPNSYGPKYGLSLEYKDQGQLKTIQWMMNRTSVCENFITDGFGGALFDAKNGIVTFYDVKDNHVFDTDEFYISATKYIGPKGVAAGSGEAGREITITGDDHITMTTDSDVVVHTGLAQMTFDTDDSVVSLTSGTLSLANIDCNTISTSGDVTLGSGMDLILGGNVTHDTTSGLYWYTGEDYSIARTAGGWGQPYAQLQLKWPTGIILSTTSANHDKGFIDCQGILGVNVSSKPSTQFEVNGDSKFSGNVEIQTTGDGTGTDPSSQLRIQDDESTNPQYLKLGVNSTDNYSYIQSTESGVANNTLLLNPLGGNVGIAETLGIGDSPSPSDTVKLHVRNRANQPVYIKIQASSESQDAGVYLGTTQNAYWPGAHGGYSDDGACKCLLLAEGASTWSRSNFHICMNNTMSNHASADATLNDSVFKVQRDGAVGIGLAYNTPCTAGVLLQVEGDVLASGNITSSDNRVKHNEQDLSGCLHTISKLKPQKYLKTKSLHDGSNNYYGTDHHFDLSNVPDDANWESGFIAQEVRVIPELSHLVMGEESVVDVSGNETPTPLALNYNSLHAYEVGAIKELLERVKYLEQEIQILKNNQ